MAADYTWPLTLPQTPLLDYSEQQGVLIYRSPMDAGPAKLRRRGERPATMNVGFKMTGAEVEILDAFIKDDLLGVARFYFTHPRTGVTEEVRIIPSGEGQMYSLSVLGPDTWRVSMQLEVLP